MVSFPIPYDKEKVREFILKFSVQDLLEQVAEERKLDVEMLNQVRAQSLAEKNAQVVLMPGAREVLQLGQRKQGFSSLFTLIRETMLLPFSETWVWSPILRRF